MGTLGDELRFSNGLLGLYVDPVNISRRDASIFTSLYQSGQLLNPVIALLLGNTSKSSRITIGALDPEDYEGTLNWVEAPTPDPSWFNVALQIDGVKGFNGSFIPGAAGPILSYISNR